MGNSGRGTRGGGREAKSNLESEEATTRVSASSGWRRGIQRQLGRRRAGPSEDGASGPPPSALPPPGERDGAYLALNCLTVPRLAPPSPKALSTGPPPRAAHHSPPLTIPLHPNHFSGGCYRAGHKRPERPQERRRRWRQEPLTREGEGRATTDHRPKEGTAAEYHLRRHSISTAGRLRRDPSGWAAMSRPGLSLPLSPSSSPSPSLCPSPSLSLPWRGLPSNLRVNGPLPPHPAAEGEGPNWRPRDPLPERPRRGSCAVPPSPSERGFPGFPVWDVTHEMSVESCDRQTCSLPAF